VAAAAVSQKPCDNSREFRQIRVSRRTGLDNTSLSAKDQAMPQSTDKIEVYLEIGLKRTFACASDWPGWSRGGRDEPSALRALCDYGARYANVLRPAQLGFEAPADPSAFSVVERLKGGATTDFGAPGEAPASDARPVDETDLRRFQALLEACWGAFDIAVQAGRGRELRKGPRGGGRELDAILEHVLGAEASYLSQLGWKPEKSEGQVPGEGLAQIRRSILEGLAASARGEIPSQGPRGGLRWTPRYFVRRSAWHVLDHAWEIEDRIL